MRQKISDEKIRSLELETYLSKFRTRHALLASTRSVEMMSDIGNFFKSILHRHGHPAGRSGRWKSLGLFREMRNSRRVDRCWSQITSTVVGWLGKIFFIILKNIFAPSVAFHSSPRPWKNIKNPPHKFRRVSSYFFIKSSVDRRKPLCSNGFDVMRYFQWKK